MKKIQINNIMYYDSKLTDSMIELNKSLYKETIISKEASIKAMEEYSSLLTKRNDKKYSLELEQTNRRICKEKAELETFKKKHAPLTKKQEFKYKCAFGVFFGGLFGSLGWATIMVIMDLCK